MTNAVSVGRFIIFLKFKNSLDVTPPVENAHHAQGFRLNDVEDEHVFEILNGPETKPGKGWILKKLSCTDVRHGANRLDGFVNCIQEPHGRGERIFTQVVAKLPKNVVLRSRPDDVPHESYFRP